MLGLITGALGGLFKGGAGSLLGGIGKGVLSTAFQTLPGMLASSGSDPSAGLDRTILDLRNQRDQIRSEQLQSMMMQRARASVGTARAVLSGQGFRSGSGSTESLGDQSMLNLAQDLSMQELLQTTGKTTSELQQRIGAFGEMQQVSPFSQGLFQNVLSPLMSSGANKLLGGLGNLLGGGSKSSGAKYNPSSSIFGRSAPALSTKKLNLTSMSGLF